MAQNHADRVFGRHSRPHPDRLPARKEAPPDHHAEARSVTVPPDTKVTNCRTLMSLSRDSVSSLIGHITLEVKLTGKRSAGKPHAAFDAAGTGNGVTAEAH